MQESIRDDAMWLVIDRPEKRNALDFDAMTALRMGLARARDLHDVRAVVLAGAGDVAFCSGADLGGVFDPASPEADEQRGELARLFQDLRTLGKPSVARVHGYCLAGGFGLAMACDFVIARADTQFGLPEIGVGLWPYMVTVPLRRSFPERVLLELMATGRRMPVEEAARYGAVNRIVARDAFADDVDAFVASLTTKSPLIMQWGLETFRAVASRSDDDAYAMLRAKLSETVQTNDTKEGLAAFAEKRAPRWTGT